jgi:hypothetical protein
MATPRAHVPKVISGNPGRQDWPTPRELFGNLDRYFGPIDIDFAANSTNTKVATNWLGPDHPDPARRDALAPSCHWHELGAIGFLNPPFGQLAAFTTKAVEEALAGMCVIGIVLADPSTDWWQWNIINRAEVIQFDGRIRFEGAARSPSRTSLVVIWHPYLLRKTMTVEWDRELQSHIIERPMHWDATANPRKWEELGDSQPKLGAGGQKEKSSVDVSSRAARYPFE